MTKLTATAGVDPSRALNEYVRDPEWMFKTGMGGMLMAGSMLVGMLDMQNPLFLPVSLAISAVICGYLLRVVRARVNNPEAPKLAEWGDWLDLFMSGITWMALQFAITVFTAGILSTLLILAFYAFMTPKAFTMAIAQATLAAVVLTIFWVHFITTYLWVNFAVEEKVTAGLALRKVLMQTRKNPGAFFLAWALSAGLQWAAIILPTLTFIGVFLVPSVLFAAQVVSANMLAHVWKSVED